MVRLIVSVAVVVGSVSSVSVVIGEADSTLVVLGHSVMVVVVVGLVFLNAAKILKIGLFLPSAAWFLDAH